MVDSGVAKIQIGKNGIGENFFQTLEGYFKAHKNVKIVVLKSAREDKENTKKYAQEILTRMGDKFSARVIGHTIALKKWRTPRKTVVKG